MAGIGTGGNHPFDPNFKRIFVGGLAGHTRDESLKDYFMRFGDVEEAFVLYDGRSGNSKRYGFVEFADHLSALMACRHPLPIIDGKLVDCKEALPRGVVTPQRSNYVNYRPTRAEILSLLSPSRGQRLHSPSPPIPRRNPTGYGQSIRHEYPNIMPDLRFPQPVFTPISQPYYEMPQRPSPSHGINFSMRYDGSSSGDGQSWSSAVQVGAAPFVVGVTAPSDPIIYGPQYPTLSSSSVDATRVHTRPQYYEDPFPYRIWFDP